MGMNSTVKSYTSRSRRVDLNLRVERLRRRRVAGETAETADTIAAAAVEITVDTDRTDSGE